MAGHLQRRAGGERHGQQIVARRGRRCRRVQQHLHGQGGRGPGAAPVHALVGRAAGEALDPRVEQGHRMELLAHGVAARGLRHVTAQAGHAARQRIDDGPRRHGLLQGVRRRRIAGVDAAPVVAVAADARVPLGIAGDLARARRRRGLLHPLPFARRLRGQRRVGRGSRGLRFPQPGTVVAVGRVHAPGRRVEGQPHLADVVAQARSRVAHGGRVAQGQGSVAVQEHAARPGDPRMRIGRRGLQQAARQPREQRLAAVAVRRIGARVERQPEAAQSGQLLQREPLHPRILQHGEQHLLHRLQAGTRLCRTAEAPVRRRMGGRRERSAFRQRGREVQHALRRIAPGQDGPGVRGAAGLPLGERIRTPQQTQPGAPRSGRRLALTRRRHAPAPPARGPAPGRR